jgi:hypothetical protein
MMAASAAPGMSMNQSPMYSGSATPQGMPAPILSGGANRLNPTSNPMPAPLPSGTQVNQPSSSAASSSAGAAPFVPAQAPNGLTVQQNPSGTTGLPSTTGGQPSAATTNLTNNPSNEGDFLSAGAGYNSAIANQAVTATQNAMQQQINQQFGSLQTAMAEAGLSPESSGFTLGESEFLSNASAQENEIAANQYTSMYEQAMQNYTSVLEQMAQINFEGQQNSIAGQFSQVFGGALGAFTGGLL